MSGWQRLGAACLLAALLLIGSTGPTRAGNKADGAVSGSFRLNHVGYEMTSVYTWPSSFDMTELDGSVVKIRFFAFSNRPMDAQTFDLLQDPNGDLDLAARLGAAVVSIGLDAKNKVHLFRYALPGATMFTVADGAGIEAEIGNEGDRWSGTIRIPGDEKLHAFDPDNVPLVQGELRFEVKDTRRPFEGNPLPEDGGAPGRVYLAFNQSLLDRDRAGVLRGLRAIWTAAGPAAGEILLWKDVEMQNLELHGGRADDRRAVLHGSGSCEAYGGQSDFRVFLVREEDGWKVDSLKPGGE